VPRPRILEPLAVRDFRLLWFGQTVSMFGNGVFTVALAWQAYELTGSPGTLAAVLLSKSIPMLALLLLGGVVTDRIDRRTLLLWSDALRAVAVASIAALSLSGSLEVWHLMTLGAIFGAAEAFFQPAATAILPDILSGQALAQANSLQAASRILGFQLVGPAVGGLLVAAAGPGWAFVLDGSTFVFAFVAALLMRRAPVGQPAGGKMLKEIAEGFRYTRAHRWLWVTLVAAAFTVLAVDGPFDVLLPLAVKERIGGGARGFGAIVAAAGVGGILAAAYLGQRGLPKRRVVTMYVSWAVSSVGIAVIAVSRSVPLAATVSALTGVGLEIGMVIWNTLVQEQVPRNLLGRVSSLDWMVSLGLTPVSYAIVGPLGVAFGAVPVLVAGGILGGVFLTAGILVPGVTAPDHPISPPDDVTPAGSPPVRPSAPTG
jgi:DHA3 family tetracycline resistance protein-like MFS transporter